MHLVYVYGCDFGGERVMIEFKGSHFERDVILWAELAKVPPAKQVEWLRRGKPVISTGVACPPRKFATEPVNVTVKRRDETASGRDERWCKRRRGGGRGQPGVGEPPSLGSEPR